MATTPEAKPPPNLQYDDHLAAIVTWVEFCAFCEETIPGNRPWCTFDLKGPLTPSNIDAYFARDDINKEFAAEVAKDELTNIPVAHLQSKADNIHALAKMMWARSKSRLATYRDDLENKEIRTPTSLNLGIAKFTVNNQSQDKYLKLQT